MIFCARFASTRALARTSFTVGTLKPARANVLLKLGVLYEDRGEYEKAAECYRQVLAQYPNHPRAKPFLRDAESSQSMVMDVDMDRLRYLDDIIAPNVDVLFSDRHTVREQLARADLVIGAVLIPGARTPRLVEREDLKLMKPGSVIIDVAVDQGGCIATTRPTTHSEPTYIVDEVLHYCVTNMPGAVGRTSTQALCHATQPYALRLARHGIDKLVNEDEAFATALNIKDGKLTNQAVAEAHDMVDVLVG